MPLSKPRLRQLWFQLHKWVGLSLALLIVPVSLTGAALVWHEPLERALHPQREASSRPILPPSAYAAAARAIARPGERLASLGWPVDEGPVVATLARPPAPGGGRPVRTMLYLDPATGSLLARAASNEGLLQTMHVLHGTLMVPGFGRQLVGWIGVAMLLSSLTGLWLWWPGRGGLRRGLRWRRQPETSGNLHHQGGFWIALPLAVLSLTGVWISFPALFAQVSGDPAGPSPTERMRRMAVRPVEQPRLVPEAALAAAQRFATGPVTQIAWPTEREPRWKLSFRTPGGAAEVAVDDIRATATPPKPPQPETTARLMRRIHDGTGMGIVWQTIIFLGGLVPAALAVTGMLMWLAARRRRRAMEARRESRRAPAAA